jgi:hypothetical protein
MQFQYVDAGGTYYSHWILKIDENLIFPSFQTFEF